MLSLGSHNHVGKFSLAPPSIHVVNISDFKLDPISDNYSKWRCIRSVPPRKSAVESHVLLDLEPLEQSAQWWKDDLQILLVIYGMMIGEMYDAISSKDNTTYRVWMLLDSFHDNLMGREIHVHRVLSHHPR
ncbi:Sulfotransferase 17 [Hordeum vulgare]|nr:Sulfotransferase 17 [Hordeum vulgare]